MTVKKLSNFQIVLIFNDISNKKRPSKRGFLRLFRFMRKRKEAFNASIRVKMYQTVLESI